MLEPTDISDTAPAPAGLTPQPPPAGPDEGGDRNRGVIRAAAVLAVGNVTQRVLGLAREVVKANLFGASGLLSAFELAAYVPTNLFELIIGGMVNSALVPIFSDYAARERRRELWAVASTVLSVAIVVVLLLVALVEVFAPQVAALLGANNFEDPALAATSIRLMRLATPAVLFLSVSSVLTGLLYALQRFTLPAFTATVFNGAVVVVALLRPDEIDSLVWGILLGSLLQILLQLPALRDAQLRWRLDWRNPVISRILRLYAPIVAGLIITQFGLAISINLATRTGDESLTYMRYATTLYQFPLGLVVTALSIATLPMLSRQAVGRLADFMHTLGEGIRLVCVLILPATAGLFALAGPIVALLFEHGQFTAGDTAMTAQVLRYYLFGLPFAAVDQMLVFASYARKDTLRPALVGVVSIVVYVLVAALLLEPYGLLSLMIADAVKHVLHTLLMLLIFRRQGISLAGQGILLTVAKALLASLAVAGAAAGSAVLLAGVLPGGFTGRLLLVGLAGTAGLLVFVVLARLLDIREARQVWGIVRRRNN